jgi:hypothetical protein
MVKKRKRPAHRVLKKWLEDEGLSYREFGESVGVCKQSIHQIATGKRNPGRDLGFRIDRATDGAVPATIWEIR